MSETANQHCQRGGSNPLDEEHTTCERCTSPMYDHELLRKKDVWEWVCAECIAAEYGLTVGELVKFLNGEG